jgi:thiamine-phosphate pyrophosphorylase
MLGRCHLITDTRFDRDPLACVGPALDAGVDVIQVRMKQESDRLVLTVVERALELCRPYGATCLVDDRVDLALVAGAHGVHLGAEDLPVAGARNLGGPGFIVGATARDPASARAAVAEGATYIGTGPAYATTTKPGLPGPIGPEGVAAVCEAVDVPVIAIGGVTGERIGELLAVGAHGVAVIGAVTDHPDPGRAAQELVRALRQGGQR